MRVACELCAAVADATVRVDGDRLAVTCAACGGTFATTLAPAPAAPPIDPSPRPSCPKCEAPAPAAGPCPRCGLAPAHAATWRRQDAEPPTASLGAAWAAVQAAWADEATHEHAAAVAIETGDYAWLAARYRAIVRTRPDDPIAGRQLQRLSRRAEATLHATATARTRAGGRVRIPYGAVIAAALVVGAGLIYANHLIGQRNHEASGRVRPAERIAPPRSQR